MENEPTQMQQELFRNRSTTREFLFSKTEPPQKEKPRPASPPNGSTWRIPSLPDLLTGDVLIETANDELSRQAEFCVMVVRIDNENGGQETAETPALVAQAIQAVCIGEKDVWGRLNATDFACFFPAANEMTGTARAEKLKKKIAADHVKTVSVGIASYPTLTYERHHILDNAYKALRHAGFFGRDSLVCFDSVSLNISGDELYQRGDIPGAVREFKMALLLDTANENVYNSLGVCYGVRNEFDRALEEFETAISLNPEEVMPLYNAGLVCTMKGDNDGALEYFLKAERIGPDIFEVAFHLGKLYVEMKKPQEARPFLERAVALRPESGPAYRFLGECYAALDLTDDAISSFTRAVKINPNDAPALSGLGHLYALQEKEIEIATMFCQQSIRIAPEEGLFRHRLGRLYQRQNRLEEALKEFHAATALGYDSAEHIDQIQSRLNAKAS